MDLPELTCSKEGTRTHMSGFPQPRSLSVHYTNWLTQGTWLSSYSLLGPLGLSGWNLAISEKTVCTIEKALAWPVGWTPRHILVPVHWIWAQANTFYSLAQFPLCSNQGLDQILPGPFQPSDSSIFSRLCPLPGFQDLLVKTRVWLSKEAVPNLVLRPS